MNKIHVFSVIFIVLSIKINATVLTEIENKEPYFFSDIFDKEIYQFDETNKWDKESLYALPLSESMGERLARLAQRKEYCLEKTWIHQIEQYKEAISGCDPRELMRIGLNSGINTLGAAGLLKLAAVGTVPFTWSGLAVGLGVTATSVAAGYFFDTTGRDEILKADALIKRLRNQLKVEAIGAAEKKYVENLEKLPNDHRVVIINALLDARKRPGLLQGPNVDALIQDIIDLPQESILPPGCDPHMPIESYNEYKKKFLDGVFPSLTEGGVARSAGSVLRLDSDFYSSEVRKCLRDKVLGKFCDAAYFAHQGKDWVKKRGVLLYGKPGTGKSSAAQLIAEELGLPYYHLSILSPSDYSKTNIYGAKSSGFHSGVKGELLKAMLSKNAKGRTGKNVVIILDDVDRGFRIDDNGLDVSGLVQFLQLLFDIREKTFDADFLDLKGLDMSQVIFIATINSDIREIPQFKALCERSIFVSFGSPTAEQRKASLKAYLEDDNFKLSPIWVHRPEQWDTIRSLIGDFLENYDTDEPRTRQQRALELLEYEPSQWFAYAGEENWKPKEKIIYAEPVEESGYYQLIFKRLLNFYPYG